MVEGIGPDVLMKRGATPKYVNMVCREFVESGRKRKGESTREVVDTILTPELVTSSLPVHSRSPPIGSVELARDLSVSSIGSIDASLKVERTISPDQPTRLIPTSSWAPTPKLPTSPIHIESYRPGRPVGSSGSSSLATQSAGPSRPAPLGPMLGPGGIPRPSTSYSDAGLKNSLRARASDLSPVVKRPAFSSSDGHTPSVSTVAPDGTHVDSHGPQPHIAPTPVAHGAHNVLASLSNEEAGLIASTIPITTTAPSSVTVLPIASTSATTATKASTMNALLESKRRAMESMRRGRKAGENVSRSTTRPPTPPLGMQGSPLPSRPSSVPPVHPLPSRPLSVPPSHPLTQENLEDQVAALEQEVIGLREAEPIVIDDEEEEEGEIPDEIVVPFQPRMAPIIPATTPIRLNKRPNAEDMMDANRSQSISSRSVHPAKRRQFGAAMRMKRLIISLDDSDDEDNEDQAPTPTAAQLEADRQRLLKEKEDDMMKLREKILRLQAKAEKEKKAKAKEAAAIQAAVDAPLPPAETAVTEDVIMAESADADRPETPASPPVPLVHDASTAEVQYTPGKWLSFLVSPLLMLAVSNVGNENSVLAH